MDSIWILFNIVGTVKYEIMHFFGEFYTQGSKEMRYRGLERNHTYRLGGFYINS